MTPVRVGLIGCGAMGRGVHLRILRTLPDFTIVAVADSDPSALARAVSLAPGSAACSTHAELLARSDLDAVVIAAPTPAHAAIARLAFDRRLHVYVEKPLAATLDDARQVVAAWRTAGTTGMMGFNYRFNPLYIAAKRCVEAGAVGTVAAVRSVFTTPAQGGGGWRGAGRPGSGALFDLGSHHFDMLSFIFRSAVADVGRVDGVAGTDSVCVSGTLEGGLLFQSLFATGSVDEDRFDIYGDRGALSIDRYRSLAVAPRGPERRSRVHDWTRPRDIVAGGQYLLEKLRSPRREPSHARALRHFAGAIRGDHPASPDLVDGLLSLSAVVAASAPEACGRRTAAGNGAQSP